MSKIPDLQTCFKQLIAAPSISSIEAKDDMSNQAVIALLQGWFTDIGFNCETPIVPDSRNKQNLIARLGSGTGGLLLAGHTDTVPFDEGLWTQDPFTLTEKNNRWYGLGTCDMKGFFALVVEALKGLPLNEFKRPLTILASADEETTMNGAKAFSEQKSISPDYAIIGEPTSLKPIYMHKGHMAKGIKVIGRSGHSSDPAKGLNSIEVMHLVIGQLLKMKQHLAENYQENAFTVPYPTMNFGHVHGGDAANRICGCCDLHLDIRPLPGMHLADLEHMVVNYLADISNAYPGSISISTLYPSSESFAGNKEDSWTKKIEHLTGNQAEVVNYATEAPYITQLGCKTLVLGPGSIAQAHQPDEFIGLEYLTPTVELLKKLIYQVCIK
ncbi:acetylornithine deacetylase [Shewanella intestini]|uniref:Acetylornithine deacetylase n=1 Tax=Shewanella intestini TaxID=2017544 RepID=A0ABS5I3V1_9GAMM|nr:MULTISPECIES: acetylornithine deacetylase [Shewanella]MBR9728697.1 acetylornithine deacetylase [Shewanella intestini]MRG37620.1 acetylornithine deacetylase [Shewanella sp. XMDDZSB0408]